MPCPVHKISSSHKITNNLPTDKRFQLAVQISTMTSFYLSTTVILVSESFGMFQHPRGVGQIIGNAPIQAHTEIVDIGITNDAGGQTNSRLLMNNERPFGFYTVFINNAVIFGHLRKWEDLPKKMSPLERK